MRHKYRSAEHRITVLMLEGLWIHTYIILVEYSRWLELFFFSVAKISIFMNKYLFLQASFSFHHMIKVSGGRVSTEKVPQTWYISLYYDVKVKVLIDSLPEEGRPLLVLSHENLLIVKLEARLASLWIKKVKDCLLSPMIRALPGQREDWRLIHASHSKCKNPEQS